MTQVSVVKTAALAVLFIALWLIVEGVWNLLNSYWALSYYKAWGLPDDVPLKTMFILGRTLPLILGCVLLNAHGVIVRYLFRDTKTSGYELSWDDSRTISALALGILGLVFLAQGISVISQDENIASLLMALTNLRPSQHFAAQWTWHDSIGQLLPIFYPIVFGAILLLSAPKIGTYVGNRIEKSLACDDSDAERAIDDGEEVHP